LLQKCKELANGFGISVCKWEDAEIGRGQDGVALASRPNMRNICTQDSATLSNFLPAK
jgi:hypothetical protein